MNFLQSNYWLDLFKLNNQTQTQQQNNSQNNSKKCNTNVQNPKVILFVALFCIALFFFLTRSPNQNVIENNIDVDHNRVGRVIQEVPKEMESLFESLTIKKPPISIESRLNDTLGRIKIKFNKEKRFFLVCLSKCKI